MSVRIQHKILFWGVFGALAMRAVFIFAGIELMEKFHWITYVFGAFLIIAAIRTLPKKEKRMEVEKNLALKFLKKILTQ